MRWLRLRCGAVGHVQPEHRAAPQARTHRHVTAQQVRQPPHDGQADAQAARHVALRVVGLIELVEHMGDLVVGNADARVPHGQAHPVAARARSHQHAPARGVLDGVVDKVGQDAQQQLAVHPHDGGRRVKAQRQPGLLRARLEQLSYAHEHFVHGHVGGARHHGTRVDARDVQHRVQQAADRVGGLHHALGHRLRGVALQVAQQRPR